MQVGIAQCVNKGMQRDYSMDKASQEFAYENRNIRITTNGDNSFLSVTNEKSTIECTLDKSIEGVILGSATIGDYIILFVKNNTQDSIYRIKLNDSTGEVFILYQSTDENNTLNFNINNPIECIAVYEADDVQKVYWVDGINQPRSINIITNISYTDNTQFDFVLKVAPDLEVNIKRIFDGTGNFKSGIIQYFISKYKKNGPSTNILYQSPLYYISPENRGGKIDEIQNLSFSIEIDSQDDEAYYMVYSAFRSSLNSLPEVSIVAEVPCKQGKIIVKDINNNIPVEDTSLLFSINAITASTLEIKDNTLFLGNIVEKSTSIIDVDELKKTIENTKERVRLITDSENEKHLPETILKFKWKVLGVNNENLNDQYTYYNQLNYPSNYIKGFKYNELYRLGVQFFDGEWSSVIPLDEIVCDKEPQIIPNIYDIKGQEDYYFLQNDDEVYNSYILLPYVHFNPQNLFDNLKDSLYYRLVIEEYDPSKKSIVYQGYLNPTLYNSKLGHINSWCLRPTGYNKHFDNVLNVDSNNNPTINTEIDLSGFDETNYSERGLLEVESSTDWNIVSISTRIRADYYPTRIDSILFTLSNNKEVKTLYCTPTLISISMYSSLDELNSRLLTLKYNDLFLDKASSSTNSAYNLLLALINNGTINNINETDFIFKNIQELPSINDKISFYYYEKTTTRDSIQNQEKKLSNNNFFVDASVVSFNVPNIDVNTPISNLNLRIVGRTKISKVMSDYYVHADNNTFIGAVASNNEEALLLNFSKVLSDESTNVGLKSFPLWKSINRDTGVLDRYVWTYLWNGDKLSNRGNLQATLKNKIFANLYFGDTSYYKNNNFWNPPKGVEELKYIKDKTLLNNGTIISNNVEYYIPILNNKEFYVLDHPYVDNIQTNTIFSEEKDLSEGISIKYNSVDNIVLKLGRNDEVITLPEYENEEDVFIENRVKDGISGDFYPSNPKYLINTYQIVDSSDNNYINLIPDSNGNYYVCTDEKIYNNLAEGDVVYIYNVSNYTISGIVCYCSEKKITSTGLYYTTLYIIKEDREDNTDLGKTYFDNILSKLQESIIVFNGYSTSSYLKQLNASNLFGDLHWHLIINYYSPFKSDSVFYENNSIYIGELYKDLKNIISYETPIDYTNSVFIPISAVTDIKNNCEGLEGDTYFQRWDSLRTYPSKSEDKQGIVDVISLMIESRVNLDGRSDVTRGRTDISNILPENILDTNNLVYSQPNNYITSTVLKEEFDNSIYPSLYTWSLSKQSSSNIDLWTKINLSSSAKLDEDKGPLTKIKRWNNQLLAFQDKGIAIINFNNQTTITSQEGVPIEIGNSGKVTGHYYLTTTQGCKNKWSIAESPYGLYFIDSYNKSISVFGSDGIKSLSTINLFEDWTRENEKGVIWNPNNTQGFKSFYDPIHKEVYFINDKEALCYNELLQQFTSFYDYGNMNTLTPINGHLYGIKDTTIYKMFEGTNYCNLFGKQRDYSITYKINKDPFIDKTWTNIEYRADIFNSGNIENNNSIRNIPLETFDTLEVWNEYQKGTTDLSKAKCKFRIWRADIPRDTNEGKGLNRIRNPWIMLKLSKSSNKRMEFHDLLIKYLQ